MKNGTMVSITFKTGPNSIDFKKVFVKDTPEITEMRREEDRLKKIMKSYRMDRLRNDVRLTEARTKIAKRLLEDDKNG